MAPSVPRTPYPSDVSDEEWGFAASSLTLMTPNAPQRRHDVREVDNALRWIVRTGAQWRYLPHAWFRRGRPSISRPSARSRPVCSRRWSTVFSVLLRRLQGRDDEPTGTIVDSRTMRSTPERGQRAGYDAHTPKRGSKIHASVDTLGELLALTVTPAGASDRAQVGELNAAVQEATVEQVEVAFVDQGYTGHPAVEAVAAHGITLAVIKLPEAKRGFVLVPRRWVVERDFAWATRFRRLVRDDERLPEAVVGLHFVAFACLMLHRLLTLAAQSP